MSSAQTGVSYFTTDPETGDNIRIGVIVPGYRIRYDATNWSRFSKPEAMIAWIRERSVITDDNGNQYSGVQFLALPAISTGAITGECKISKGYVYNLA